MPPELPAGTAVEVFFTYAENGHLTVKGRLPDLEREALLAIERSSGLSDAKLQEWDKRLKTSRGG